MCVAADGTENRVVMAVAGRIPVKVSSENGAINIGDLVAASSLEGHGMKATQTGRVIGVALEAFNATTSTSTSKVLVLVNPHWYYTSDVEILQGGGSGDMEMNNFTFDESLTTVIQVGTLVANNVYTLSLTVGTEERPGGITLYDVQTKKPYCVLMRNGDLIPYPGKCEDNYLVNPAAAPFAEESAPPSTENANSTDATTTPEVVSDTETSTSTDSATTTDVTVTEPEATSIDSSATTTATSTSEQETLPPEPVSVPTSTTESVSEFPPESPPETTTTSTSATD